MKLNIKEKIEYYARLSINTRYIYNKEEDCIYVEVWRFFIKSSTYIPCVINNIPTKIIRK